MTTLFRAIIVFHSLKRFYENASTHPYHHFSHVHLISQQVVTYPYGEHPVGQLLYDRKGNMMVEIMKPGIKKFVQSNLLEGVPDEVMPAYYGFIAYYGTYKLVPDSAMVIHNIKACSFPNWVDEDQKRYYEFKNDQLILRTSLIGSVRYELTWQKNDSSH